jgi:hypothetical protein
MSWCIKCTVKMSLPVMSLVTIYCLACVSFEKAQAAEGKPEATGNVEGTTICEIVSNPGTFNGKMIELRASVLAGLETNVLFDGNCSVDQSPVSILLDESSDVPRTENSEYRKFWNLVQAYEPPKGKGISIMPDKYTVTATVIGRFDAGTPSGTGFCGKLVLRSVRDVLARPFDSSFWALTSCELVKNREVLHERGVSVRGIYTEHGGQERLYSPGCPQCDEIAIQWPDNLSGALKRESRKLKQFVAKDAQARAWVVIRGVFYGPEPFKKAETASSIHLSTKEQIRKSHERDGFMSEFDYMIKVTKLIKFSAVATEVPGCPKSSP